MRLGFIHPQFNVPQTNRGLNGNDVHPVYQQVWDNTQRRFRSDLENANRLKRFLIRWLVIPYEVRKQFLNRLF